MALTTKVTPHLLKSRVAFGTRLSDAAPQLSAHILSRDTDSRSIPSYTVSTGNKVIRGLDIDQVFDYVSPQEYEAFEHACFKRDVEEVVRRERETPVVKKRRGRPPRTAHADVVASSGEEVGEDGISDGVAAASEERDISVMSAVPLAEPVVMQGRHGRPRPTYTHMYKKRRQKNAKVETSDTSTTFQGRKGDANKLSKFTSSLSLDEQPKRRKIRHESTTDSAVSEEAADPASRYSRQPSPRVASKSSLSAVGHHTIGSSTPSDVEPDQQMTVIVSPAKTGLLASIPDVTPSSDEDDVSWEIEAILDHRMSDPRTHRAGDATRAVMLYHVKWVGDETTTWEPKEAFDDGDTLDHYWALVQREQCL